MALYSAIAFAIAGFAFVVSALYGSFEWYYLSFITSSFGGSMGIMMSTQLVDFTHDLDQRAGMVGGYTSLSLALGLASTAAIAAFFVEGNPTDYTLMTFVLFVASLSIMVLTYFTWPESLVVRT